MTHARTDALDLAAFVARNHDPVCNEDTEYTVTVTFTRPLQADIDVVRENRVRPYAIPKALVAQIVAELQEYGYDDGWMPGSFQVNSITINGETTEVKP